MDRMDDGKKLLGVSSGEKRNMLYGDFIGIIFLHAQPPASLGFRVEGLDFTIC